MVHRPPVLLMLRSYNSFGLERALSLGAALVRQTQGTLPHLLDECPSLRLLQVLLVEDLLDAEARALVQDDRLFVLALRRGRALNG